MNGANMSVTEPYAPETASYDYDAPLDEAGNPTTKYYKFREVISRHLAAGTALPDVPEKKKRIVALEIIKFSGRATLFNNLPEPVAAAKPMSFEELDQGYGFVLYRTTLTNAGSGSLEIGGLRDFATVYVNGKFAAVLDRRLKLEIVNLQNIAPNATLDILVENTGRINYGPYLTDNRQGITGKVKFNGQELSGWQMFKLPFNNVSGLKYLPNQDVTDIQPALYRGIFGLRGTVDTYLDMHGFGKGFVFVNGHNLGRYWEIGPQQTIYLPAVWLKKGQNEIVVFDELKGNHHDISTLGEPVLNEVNNPVPSK